MKKIVCVMIIGTVLICTFFAGCGKAEDGKVSDTSSSTNPTSVAESMVTNASENLSSMASEVSSDLSSAVSNTADDVTSTTKR